MPLNIRAQKRRAQKVDFSCLKVSELQVYIHIIFMPEISLRIVLERPTVGVIYGLQKGKGNDYETVQKQMSDGSDIHFEFNVEVKSGDHPNFLGPFTQGGVSDRFIYIDIGTCAGQQQTMWSRRLKIPMNISKDMVDRWSPSDVIVAKVAGSGGKDGSPTCGTIKPFSGWKMEKKESS